MRPPRRRRRRVLRWIGGGLLGAVLLAVGGVVVWSQVGVYAAEPDPLAAARADADLRISDDGGSVVMVPTDPGEGASVGLVFIPGAKVDPWAYVSTLSGLVTDDGVTVVITRPWLNLAFFDLRPLADFTALAPDVDVWAVGGHSLGGVRACALASDADALMLFASYCAQDVSGDGIPVLSLSGSEDGLSTPQKIDDARHLLPRDARLIEIDGASHASFGAYGRQDGDGTPTIMLDEITDRIATEAAPFVDALRTAASGG